MPSELRHLTRLALPVVAAQVGNMTMGVVDTIMVGRVSVEALASAAMANTLIWGSLLVGQGLLYGIDPLVTQAHGAGRGERAALAFQRGLVLALAISLPLAGLWAWAEPFLLLTGQLPSLTGEAHRYTAVQIPSIPCFLAFVVLRQYLQGREIVRPAMWVAIVANVFNAFFNYVLIFGKLGFPELGLLGAGIATTLTRIFMLGALVGCVVAFALHRGAWRPWSREAFDPVELRRIFAVGIPMAAQIAAEVWAFSGSTLLAGRLGATALSAHTIALNLAALTFMVPLGISHAAVTRVGNLLGAGAPPRAQQAGWVAIATGAAFMGVAAATFVGLREWLPAVYTADPEVIALCALVLPIAGAFQIFDGVQVVATGVMRATGRTRPAAWLNFVGYWVISLPLGGYAALYGGWGLSGLWWALCLGLAIVSIGLLGWVHFRGPARATAEFV